MGNQKAVRVELGSRSYDIRIGRAILPEIGGLLRGRHSVSHAVLICDGNVVSPHGEQVEAALTAAGIRVSRVAVEPGEGSKSVDSAARLWEKLLECHADRQSVVVAVGGGVVGDLAGFIAATFARGIRFFQVPSTLLAQVDSSVGGKVGVNLPGAKNMVGAFWQPLGVLIDTDVLATLREREYRSGLAEVVKYGVILDEQFFAYLEENAAGLNRRESNVMARVIERCCQLKADVVQADETETTGLRAVLNYGHTFAHAYESVTGYGELLHGEAVSIGMHRAALLSVNLGRVEADFVQRQRALLEKLNLPLLGPAVAPDALLAAMASDKKVADGKLKFVLPTRLGHVELVGNVPDDEVLRVLVD